MGGGDPVLAFRAVPAQFTADHRRAVVEQAAMERTTSPCVCASAISSRSSKSEHPSRLIDNPFDQLYHYDSMKSPSTKNTH